MTQQTIYQAIKALTPHPGQLLVLDSKARFRVVACGRRWGKTEIGKIAALNVAAQGKIVWWIISTQTQIRKWDHLYLQATNCLKEPIHDQVSYPQQ